MPHDATAAQVKSALEELHAIDELRVSGSAGGPWTVTFVGDHSGLNQPKLNGDAASLTSGTGRRSTGSGAGAVAFGGSLGDDP